MNLSGLIEDRSAVSSVISVILMVAITVILAAVVATFALDIGESTSSEVPQASFTAEQYEMNLQANGPHSADFWVLRITLKNGDVINQERLNVTVDGEQAWGVTNDTHPNAAGYTHESAGLWDGSGDVTSGDSIVVVHEDSPNFDSDGEQYTILPDGSDDPDVSELYHTGPGSSGQQVQLEEGDTVRVTWQSRTGEETAILFERTIR